MKKILFTLCSLFTILAFTACSDDKDVNAYDPYKKWPARNAAWFNVMADSASTAIAQAKKLYGNEWEQHTEWRMYRDLSIATGTKRTDSVVVRYVKHGDGEVPCYNDTVRINYRGWMMPNTYRIDGRDTTFCFMFDQSFYGNYGAYNYNAFDASTAVPSRGAVSAYVLGFSSVLQNMHAGDQAHVFIPSDLAYGAKASGVIPANSTLHFFLHLVDVTQAGWY